MSLKPLTVTDVVSGFSVKAWETALGVLVYVNGEKSAGLLPYGERWGFTIAKISGMTSGGSAIIPGFMWTQYASNSDAVRFSVDLSAGTVNASYKSKTGDYPYYMYCNGFVPFA